ncbi:MAG TPA: pyrimidine-nucleoside phosphorylase, partial [Bacilli bacterium]
YLVEGYCNGEIPDYQMSAWTMAVCFQGMSGKETADLTMAMARSGDQLDLSTINGVKVDKHSTGGVGDKTTLVLAALVAAAGVPVAKMSGRGLGHTGGTIDKLEAIPGFKTEQTKEQFIAQVNRCGVAVIGQSGNITPADKKLYGLRDVTATVNSIPLIASSIMSKKIASGADAIVLDVKTGNGAFMKTLEESIALAQAMVKIGNQVGRETIAVITDMEQPLGFAVGNALEVKEAINTLQGKGPKDLEELCLVLGAYMLVLGKKAQSYDEAKQMLAISLHNGKGLNKFKQFVAEQGGDPHVIDQPDLLPGASHCLPVISGAEGYISEIKAQALGRAAMMLGAGRETKDSVIDLGAGLVLAKKAGDKVSIGDVLAELYTNSTETERNKVIQVMVTDAFTIVKAKVALKPLVYAVVGVDGEAVML